MKQHTWVVETIKDIPGIGDEDFWQCSDCQASGGGLENIKFDLQPGPKKVWNVRSSPRTPKPFWAGSGISLPEDCDESRQIAARYESLTEEEQLLVRGYRLFKDVGADEAADLAEPLLKYVLTGTK